MRADLIKEILESKKMINFGTEEWDELSIEEKVIWSLIQETVSKGSAAAFNALLNQRYGVQSSGNGEELTGGSEIHYDVSFRGAQKEINED